MAALLFAASCSHSSKSGVSSGSATTKPVQMSESPAPWPAPQPASPYITAAGLQPLTAEELAFHTHAHLDIFVDGQREPVAANIGIDLVNRRISTLHTHDETGIVHMEAPKPTRFTLSQFFTQWGVRLDDNCTGGYCEPEKKRAVYVNGELFSGSPTHIELTAHEEIAMVIGTPPAEIPKDYEFPEGY